MKIRFLIMNGYTVGGTVRTTLNTAAALARRHGHDVEIVSVYRRRATPYLPVDPAVTLRTLTDDAPEARRSRDADRRAGAVVRRRVENALAARPSRLVDRDEFRYDNFNLLTDAHLVRYIRSVRDGVLIGTRPALNLMIARFGRPGVLRIGQEHLYLGRHRKALRRQIRRHYPKLDVVAALTEHDAHDYQALVGGRTRIVRVPNAVPDVGGHRAHGDSKVVVSAGRLSIQKGFDRLIPAFAQVAAKHPDWTLKIFGSGKDADMLQSTIDELGMRDNIRLMGYTKRLQAQMAKSAIYVMSSRFEGFPMVLLEAMACGLPVVSFACRNGPRDLIDNDVNGLLVDNGDIDGLAAAIITLIEDPDRRRTFGQRALEVSDHYHIEDIADQWNLILRQEAAARAAATR